MCDQLWNFAHSSTLNTWKCLLYISLQRYNTRCDLSCGLMPPWKLFGVTWNVISFQSGAPAIFSLALGWKWCPKASCPSPQLLHPVLTLVWSFSPIWMVSSVPRVRLTFLLITKSWWHLWQMGTGSWKLLFCFLFYFFLTFYFIESKNKSWLTMLC